MRVINLTSSETIQKQLLQVEKYACKLSIKDLRLWVHLGCSDEEKAHPQAISVTLKLYFIKAPLGIITDELTDSICYFQITELVQNTVSEKSFNLVEHLTYKIREAIYQHLKSIGYEDVTLKVTVDKLSPPVPNLLGGVSFSY